MPSLPSSSAPVMSPVCTLLHNGQKFVGTQNVLQSHTKLEAWNVNVVRGFCDLFTSVTPLFLHSACVLSQIIQGCDVEHGNVCGRCTGQPVFASASGPSRMCAHAAMFHLHAPSTIAPLFTRRRAQHGGAERAVGRVICRDVLGRRGSRPRVVNVVCVVSNVARTAVGGVLGVVT